MSDERFLETIQRFNDRRDFSNKAFESVCYAPFVSMYFDQHGDVRVCCQNVKHTIGNITERTLDEIWHGEKVRNLRASIRKCDLRNGCGFCEWQFLDGNDTGEFIRTFDQFAVATDMPAYPKLMEFSISNTCNLECLMCNGEWSSSIRTKREKKKPLPKLYGESFFAQLRSYLPHLERADFYGGEPFLEHEAYKIWNMMIEMDLKTLCRVTTNGTQYNEKVERVIHSLPFEFTVSMEGVTKQTVEKIRKNSNFEEVISNFKRFHSYARSMNTGISFTMCLMTLNWHEFGDFLLFADQWDVGVFVNTVTNPRSLSLYHLSKSDLAEVVRQMEQKDDFYLQRLGRNRGVWITELDRLRRALENFSTSRNNSTSFWGAFDNSDEIDSMNENAAAEVLREWGDGSSIASIRCDTDLHVIDCDIEGVPVLRLTNKELIGNPLSDVHRAISRKLGGNVEPLRSDQFRSHNDDLVVFKSDCDLPVFVRAISVPLFDDKKQQVGLKLLIGVRRSPEPALVQIDGLQR
jgi:radical SAM protein with 4Fe4S-binding SPASM domain